jgi:excisionase family DNA binding protein
VSEDRLLKVGEVTERLGLSRSTVMGLLARGDIESLTIGRARRVMSSRLEAWIETRAESEARRREKAVSDLNSETAREGGHGTATHSRRQ